MKRSLGLPPTGSSSLSPSTSRSSSASSLDSFHAIGASLKRVKISTSPGELRLNRDLEEAAAAGRKGGASRADNDNIVWIAVDPTDPNRGGWADPMSLEPPPFAPAAAPQAAATIAAAAPGGASAMRHTTPPLELRSADGMSVLRRDPVDPLRLRLSVAVPTASAIGSGFGEAPNVGSCECWTYLLQIPRMYPHSPPIIVRVTRSTPQQHQIAGVPTLQPGLLQHSNVEDPPALERVIVTVSPPSLGSSFESSRHGQQSKNEDSTECAKVCQQSHEDEDSLDWSEEKYDGWSPISSLVDLLLFLVELPHRRREKWREARRTKRRQRRFIEQQQREGHNGGVQQRRRQEGQVNGENDNSRFRRQVSMTPYDDLEDNTDNSSGMGDDGIISRPQASVHKHCGSRKFDVGPAGA